MSTPDFALVLGGGGSVGMAWEVGVLAGLADAGVDARKAAAIVGSSAGSVVGTRIRQATSIEALVESEQKPRTGDGAAPPRTTDLTPLIEIMGALYEMGRSPETFQEAGRRAIAADTPPESEWIDRFAHLGDEWPQGDLRLTAVDCTTGLRRVWTAADGVPLAPAVASSCTIPGVFPPVTLDGSRYIDGGLWSSSNLDVVLDSDVERAIFIGPLRAGDPTATKGLEREIDLLTSKGRRAEAVVPGEAFATEIGAMNLMNDAYRDRGIELGFEDGAAAASSIRELLA